ncbi:MAG: matrixin family metalloprotease [Christensenellales bacterium]
MTFLVPAQRQATIAHELGHGMGLSHYNTWPASIMCQYVYGRTATRTNATDCGAINHIYG